MSFVLRVLVNAGAIWLTTLLLGERFTVVGGGSATGTVLVYLGVALVFAVVNAVVKPLLKLVSIPFYLLTLGLFGLVVNALVLLAVAWVTGHADWGLRIDGFWWAVLAGVVVSILNGILSGLVSDGGPSSKGAVVRR